MRTHKNATTTPEIRALLQQAQGSDYALAQRFGISRATVRKWRQRNDVADASHAAHRPREALAPEQQALVVWLRVVLQLPLDDLLEAVRVWVTPRISRSALDRLLRRHLLSGTDRPSVDACGELRIDVLSMPDGRRMFVAVDAASRWAYAEVRAQGTPTEARRFLSAVESAAPFAIRALQPVSGPNELPPRGNGDPQGLRDWLAQAERPQAKAIAPVWARLPPVRLSKRLLHHNTQRSLRVLGHRTPLQAATNESAPLPNRGEPVQAPVPPQEAIGRGRGRPVSTATRESILDAAEHLFAGFGYNGVSIQAITEHAGVRKSLAMHHFGSKEDLFRAVLERRASRYTRDLREALDRSVEAAGTQAPSVDALLRALAETILRWVGGDAQSRAYIQLLAQISAIPGQDALLAPYREHYASVTRAFIDQLRRALPQMSEARLHWAFYFVEAAFVHIVTESCLLEQQTQGLCRLTDHTTIVERFVDFFGAGFRGTAQGGALSDTQV